MSLEIKKVGVIGAGVMGATIAAHMAGVGIPTVLLDIVPPKMPDDLAKKGVKEDSKQFRNLFAAKGLEGVKKSRPASFYTPSDAELITIGNLEDDFDQLADCDWIVEVVVELLKIKQDLLSRIEKVVKPTAIVTTNTSGISVGAMSAHCSEAFQKRFFGTHYFNPPRYMKLFELIPGPKTDKALLDDMAKFAEDKLGKGVVWAKDTPNFIANRIGSFAGNYINQLIDEMDLSFEEADALTGPVIGHPKMATYKLADLVGLDTMAHVADNVYDGAPDDEKRDVFKATEWITKMVENKLLGMKTKGGFYKKDKVGGKKVSLVLDRKTMEYREPIKPEFEGLTAAKGAKGLAEKMKTLYYGTDKAAEFSFKSQSEILIYSANRVPEIADDVVNIDNAMKWGFNWQTGPFETWDALGVEESVAKMKAAGMTVPAWVEEMLAAGCKTFYKKETGKLMYYDVASKSYKDVPVSPNLILLPSLKEQNKVVASNSEASVIDMGDGVACLEFHSKMNALGDDMVSMISQACDIVMEKFDGMVIANNGTAFCAGANIFFVLAGAMEGKFDLIEQGVKTLQDAMMKMKYLPKPVVAAPHAMALGGGCEVCLHSDKIVGAAETYAGLVEVGVGLIPAGGGTKELLIRNSHERVFPVAKGGLVSKQIWLLPFIARAFQNIATAQVGTSFREAQAMGTFRSTDVMVPNADFRFKKAKDMVLAMNMVGYEPPKPVNNIRVMGRDTLAVFKYALYNMNKAGYASDYDVVVGTEVARILTGGDVLADTFVTEQHLLDLERESFVRLCGNKQTQDRMEHMLKTGKPLRN